MTGPALVRLLQLASPALPVGGYTYSQGLEWAVESGQVKDEAGAARWIGDLLEYGIGRLEAPLLAALHRAWAAGDAGAVADLDARFVASRETAELRAETLQMGYSLARLLNELPDFPAGFGGPLAARREVAYPTAWSCAAAAWGIAAEDALSAYLWAWLENQVLAAVKLVPLGQTAGQRLLTSLGSRIPAVAEHALDLPEDEWSNWAPGLAIASSVHESQYSRLFRS